MGCLAALACMVSCIHDDNEDCHTNYVVEIGVMDKNYANASLFPQWPVENETQSFGHFQQTLYYTLTDARTKAVIKQSNILPVHESSATYKLMLEDLPMGDYTLTVWGNLRPDAPAGILHPDGREYEDIYVGTVSFSTRNSQSSIVALQRAKGKLLVFCTNFPEDVTRMREQVTGVCEKTDGTLHYSGSVTVEKEHTLSDANDLAVAPSSGENPAKLNLTFYRAEGNFPVLTVPEMEVTLNRNQLSAVRVNYNEELGTWDIDVYLDGKWTSVHHLNI